MKQLVLIGQSLDHSLSPVMHNAALSAMGMDDLYHYELLPMRPKGLLELVESIRNQSIGGANITIPYKSEIISYLPSVEEESRILGAVNTIYCPSEGPVGCNTDVFGFREALKEHAVSVSGIRALILGAGGAARAVAYAMAEEDVGSLEILGRNQRRAQDVVDMIRRRFDIRVRMRAGPISEYNHLETDFIVNCTPVGMFRQSITDTPLETSLLTDDMTVMDLVYNPLKTRLLREAERVGCKTIGGVEMLVHQGAASLELWTGRAPPTEVMKKAVLVALGGGSSG